MTEFYHAASLASQIRETPELQGKQHAALVRLALTLARQMDTAGAEPSTRLSATYLSVLKDISRIAAGSKSRTVDGGRKRSALARMRAEASGRGAAPTAEEPVTAVTHEPATSESAGIGAGNADVEELRLLDPPPRSVKDVRERLRWGTTRASAAMRVFREEGNES